MSDLTVRRVGDMPTIYDGVFVLARASLGVSSFGIQLLNVPPGWTGPEHAHEGMTGELAAQANDGQEEVYIGIEGSAVLHADGNEVLIEPDIMVRCGPSVMRQLVTHEFAARILVVGAIPGRAYSAPPITKHGAAEI